jgi:hypothetical protein
MAPLEAGSRKFPVSSCRSTRVRPAPNSIRSASSRDRAIPCAISRLVTLAQAMSGTIPTDASNIHKAGRTGPSSPRARA